MTESRRPSPASPLPTRRQVLQAAAAAALAAPPALRSVVYAAGSDKSEKEEVRIGFIPLTDCASVVMASVLGFDKKYGVKFIPSPPTSRPGGATRCSPTPR